MKFEVETENSIYELTLVGFSEEFSEDVWLVRKVSSKISLPTLPVPLGGQWKGRVRFRKGRLLLKSERSEAEILETSEILRIERVD